MRIFGIKIKKFWFYFIILVLLGTILGYIIGLLIDTGIFKQKAIDQKYCYYFINDSINKVYAADNIEKGYQIIAYFYCEKTKDKKGIIIGNNMFLMGNKIKKVEVLEYTEDLLLSKIRYEYYSELRGGMTIKVNCYVPYFTLHDTLPARVGLQPTR